MLNADGVENAPIKIMNYQVKRSLLMVMIHCQQNLVVTGYSRFGEIGMKSVVWEVKNSYGEGGFGVKGAHVTVRDCFVHHNWGGGITMMGIMVLAQNNRIWYNGRSNEFSSLLRGGWPAAITCARYPSYCTLKGNISWENWG